MASAVEARDERSPSLAAVAAVLTENIFSSLRADYSHALTTDRFLAGCSS
ncbi:MAG: hypothetical protein HC936_12650, partial [Leptolyngbyaceae cyanobacterium SU_3_3]|nr:hypothetical protein [Leptolyngbyaceae cyanobacterium SU_3_3]